MAEVEPLRKHLGRRFPPLWWGAGSGSALKGKCWMRIRIYNVMRIRIRNSGVGACNEVPVTPVQWNPNGIFLERANILLHGQRGGYRGLCRELRLHVGHRTGVRGSTRLCWAQVGGQSYSCDGSDWCCWFESNRTRRFRLNVWWGIKIRIIFL